MILPSNKTVSQDSDRLRVTLIGDGPPWPPAVARLLGGTSWCELTRVRPSEGEGAITRFACDAVILTGTAQSPGDDDAAPPMSSADWFRGMQECGIGVV
ncbi:MAG: hypothetical protein V3T70_07140, partial [Phycisphaerae bacterium]